MKLLWFHQILCSIAGHDFWPISSRHYRCVHCEKELDLHDKREESKAP